MLKALRYKPEGRGFETDEVNYFYHFKQSFQPSPWALGFTQCLTGTSTRGGNRNVPGQ
jgi:hypothetical protein